MTLSAPQRMLIDALNSDSEEQALTAIQALDNLNFITSEGKMPLHLACQKPWVSVVNAILTKGAKSHFKTREGNSALHLAQQHGHLAVAVCLTSHNPALCTLGNREGKTPLHQAAGANLLPFLKHYLTLEIDVDVKDLQKSTPLHEAAKGKHLEAIQLLIAADVNIELCDEEAKKAYDHIETSLLLEHDPLQVEQLQQMMKLLKKVPSLFLTAAIQAFDALEDEQINLLPEILLEQTKGAVTYYRENKEQQVRAEEEVAQSRIDAAIAIKQEIEFDVLLTKMRGLGFHQ
ncbi:ankyrin repeat domain-containing protein [Candidatus Berkiella aquae]|uniref:Ankyrin repeat domain-containing protein n=1 Tax=Candidatus Berkiella aquae TaxID=295108 RepID=A0A0Q9YIR1_9GAMM|nr:ankyrin repeat domain-containing protein [Candidatus Berkiella aquae]MCS5712212.1 ankyrin repeat domain-containing protein [Candidatus Berkiella aquae]